MATVEDQLFSFSAPTDLRFGSGALDLLGSEASAHGWQKAYVISDSGLRQAGLIDRLEAVLKGNEIEYLIYEGVQPNPSVKVVEKALAPLAGFKPDLLIGFGGGSALDAAKIINVLYSHGGQLWDYEGQDAILSPCKPLIAIPTTAGTGSEVTQFAMISDPSRRRKVAFASRHLMPTLALVDPMLTLTLPPSMTAATGMDALTHAIEACTTIAAQPISDLLALRAIDLIKDNLPRAYSNGQDQEARGKMALASTLAGIAFNNAYVALAHSIAHSLGGLYELPHGICCALALPVAMEYNLPARREQYARIARALGATSPEAGVVRVRELARQIKIPEGLRALGLKAPDVETIARAAMEDGSTLFNPRELGTETMSELIQQLV